MILSKSYMHHFRDLNIKQVYTAGRYKGYIIISFISKYNHNIFILYNSSHGWSLRVCYYTDVRCTDRQKRANGCSTISAAVCGSGNRLWQINNCIIIRCIVYLNCIKYIVILFCFPVYMRLCPFPGTYFK